eukprot:CAMPEP_0197232464 /NCGR_PEP_ID=MMETSP1429-20130617/712_1 /TAXON_ID=49237 /ORGANISM="Chaetoceros  sp., Strain UNC1202" /LENGTH=253 /DNA_ID=CAMNT_0042690489 /DNA_START=21 /DNA_END=782 /DNA_ORIENTATION=-
MSTRKDGHGHGTSPSSSTVKSQWKPNGGKSLTKEKIAALESIGFCWDQTTYNWYSMYERLKQYKREKGQQWEEEQLERLQEPSQRTSASNKADKEEEEEQSEINDDDLSHKYFHIPPEDVANRDLRLWISVQRKEYSYYMQNKNMDAHGGGRTRRTSMNPRRKRALDVIGFPWNLNKQKYGAGTDGPSVDDWSKLFEEMRERGIDKDTKPKEHWFEGQSLFGGKEGNVWEGDTDWKDDDLLDLWNMEDEGDYV